MIRQSLDRLAHGVRLAAGAALVWVAIMMIATIAGRYVGFATAWADEAARIGFVWSACLGAASGVHHGLHFAVNLFDAKLAGQIGRIIATLIAGVIILVCAMVLWATSSSIPVAARAQLPALGLSGAWFHWAITVFAALAIIFMLGRTLAIWQVQSGQTRAP